MACFTCDNEKCAYDYGYVKEECGPQIGECYSLKNLDGKTYKAGCLSISCDEMRRSSGQSCDRCDSELCNGLRDLSNYPKIGSGVTFNSSLNSYNLSFILLIFIVILIN